MPVIRDIMSSDLVTVRPETSLQEVAQLMRDRDIGDVLITENDRLTGIVTDRDLVVRALSGDISNSSSVRDVMTSGNLLTCAPDTDVRDAARQMSERQVRRLPVVENGRPVGVVSLGDLAVRAETGADERALEGISQPGSNNKLADH